MTAGARSLAEHARPAGAPVEPTVSAALVRGVLRFAVAEGLQVEAAEALLGAHRASLDDADQRLPATLYDAVFVACCRAAGHADFGTRLGSAARLGQLGALGFLLASSPTLGAALQAYARYQRALGDTLQLRLQVRGNTATLSVLPMHDSAAHPQRIEAMLAAVHVLLLELSGRAVPWRSLSLPHAPAVVRASGRPSALQRLLGVAPTPGPGRLGFERSVLDWPVVDAAVSPALTAALHAHLAPRAQLDAAASATRDVAAAARRRLSAQRRATLAPIAAELQMSPRLLQLRLHEEGTSFRAVVDGELARAAVAFLRSGTAAAEVARLLGFSEEAAFFRAFKRWTGKTPAQARAAN